MRTWALGIWALIALVAFSGFIALGNWQLERRAWKLDLLQRIDERVHSAAVAAPPESAWGSISAGHDEYRRIRLTGTYLHDKLTLVQATTTLGGGFWVLAPFLLTDGSTVLINRGFVPQGQQNGAWRSAESPSGPITISGLLRLTEPDGAFLRTNDANANRWHSRDVARIAAHLGLTRVAPYFVDLDAQPFLSPEQPPPANEALGRYQMEVMAAGQTRIPDSELPVAGLTVITFNNNHLTYLLTWYGLALMVALASAYVWREEHRLRRQWKKAYTASL